MSQNGHPLDFVRHLRYGDVCFRYLVSCILKMSANFSS